MAGLISARKLASSPAGASVYTQAWPIAVLGPRPTQNSKHVIYGPWVVMALAWVELGLHPVGFWNTRHKNLSERLSGRQAFCDASQK